MHLDELHDGAVDLEGLDEGHRLGRRTFLMGALATGAFASGSFNYAAAARRRRIPLAKQGRFPLGVASGFPRPQGITLWTQLDEVRGHKRLKLLVAEDRKFRKVVEERTVTARKDRGHTARTFVNGLKPDERYYYRFVTEDSKSPVGRFKTAPPLNSNKPVRIAFYSCQHYEAGFYNAQRAIANEPDLDLVICLGDYMYEYSDFNDANPRQDRTGRNRDGDVQFLDEYRQKYHLYKGDANLKAMHAAHPFISVWDDHEVEDNNAGANPSSAAEPGRTNLKNYPRRVSYDQRRENGYRAFFNYMPRMRFKGDRNRIFEDYRLGKTVDLMLTDERQYRDQQPCNDQILTPCPASQDPRTLLGAKQKQWLLASLDRSPATWKVWGTQLMLMGLRLGPSPVATAQVDAWDGYARERKEILDFVIDRGVKDVVAITGDIHTFFAGTATTTGDRTAGNREAFPEFVGGSATSAGLPEATGFPPETLELLLPFNGHLDFYDFTRKGYGLVEAGANGLTCELKAVNHKTPDSAQPTTIAKYQVNRGDRAPHRLA